MCEGAVTEPEYIKAFCTWRRNPLVVVQISDDHGVPRTLVDAAKKKLNDTLLDAQAHKDDNLSFDEVWCVFDVDEHPGVNDALQMARDNGIRVALSNPCFELWLLLHFRDSPGAHYEAFNDPARNGFSESTRGSENAQELSAKVRQARKL